MRQYVIFLLFVTTKLCDYARGLHGKGQRNYALGLCEKWSKNLEGPKSYEGKSKNFMKGPQENT